LPIQIAILNPYQACDFPSVFITLVLQHQIVLKVAITCKNCKTCVLGISSKIKGRLSSSLSMAGRSLKAFSWSFGGHSCVFVPGESMLDV